MANWSDLYAGRPVGSETANLAIITDRIDNLVDGLDGTDSLTNLDINGGAIDGVVIGGNDPVTLTSDSSTLTNSIISATSLVTSSADINGGSIDAVTLGTNSDITEAQIDTVNIDGSTVSTSGELNLTSGADDITLTPAREVVIATQLTVTNQLRCKVYKSTNQGLDTGVEYDVTWDSESFDVGGLHDTVTNNERITIPSGGDGVYLFIANFTFDGTPSVCQLKFYVDGVLARQVFSGTGNEQDLTLPLSVSEIFPLTAGQYVKVGIYTNVAHSSEIQGGSQYSALSVIKIA